MLSSKHTGRDTAVCLSRVGGTAIDMGEMDSDLDRTIVDNDASNVPAPAQGTAPANSRLETLAPQVVEVVRRERPPVDNIRKQGAKKFWANKDDDSERVLWLENTIRVFDELSCTPEECLKCAVSLLRDSVYRWWNTLVSVVPRERVS
ncbi:Chaperone surA [Gossypium australe]|uniref:Chaperone surA n=1 Tax=Gossypium australe TaxID=47621 RepID=A0A5B6WQ71_9ROSI|nr:Chaperone surA [Gossypium australe]